MKRTLESKLGGFVAAFLSQLLVTHVAAQQTPPIAPGQISAAGQKQYSGSGLSVTAAPDGVLLRCVFQRMDGRATADGLWLTSTVDGAAGVPFRVKAVALGRDEDLPQSWLSPWEADPQNAAGVLPPTGTVTVADNRVQFVRPGLIEEYSVSMDGVRQDFIIPKRPDGNGQLRLELSVEGAKAEQLVEGARLILADGTRKLNYHGLRVSDANGRNLTVKLQVVAEDRLAILVDDADATFPVRIDPTFSDANWVSINSSIPGASSTVYAAVVDDVGNLYIGGDFTIVGDVVANRIAKWDGSSWSALGSGMDGTVNALVVSGSDVYAGGGFSTAGGTAANRIAKWSGSSWSALGVGVGRTDQYAPYIYALTVFGSNVYAGGNFTSAGGGAANYIAKWDGNDWTPLGTGMGGGFGAPYVSALVVLSSNVYAGGGFTTAGGSAISYMAKWDGSGWSALGSGINGGVTALAISGSNIYVGGSFTTAGGSAASRIAKWNGSSWSALGTGVNSYVSALAVSGSNLYVGGNFTMAGGNSANSIAKWDGSAWSTLGSGMNADVNTLAAWGNQVYAAGYFTIAGGIAANYAAKWNGNNWSALGSGMNGSVLALAFSDSQLYVGGAFTTVGSIVANRIAKWDGNSWSALGLGVDGFANSYVAALAVSGSNLYAGGYFTTAGGAVADYIAMWNGNSWSALGLGMGYEVKALAVLSNDLYAGGLFTTAGGSPANRIAKWNGSNWTALGSGQNGDVLALAVSGNDVYAGGGFTTVGGSFGIAKWNGSSWSGLGSGMGGIVRALAVSGSNLYAGGDFTTAGGSPANRIAKWNGSSWLTLGSGMGGTNIFTAPLVSTLAVSGNDLYAGGWFTTAGGSAANYIAKWNGSDWTPLGSGVNGYPNALLVSGSDLYVGGSFTTAGGKLSAYVAKALLNGPPLAFMPKSVLASNGVFNALLSGPESNTVIVDVSSTLPNWTPVATNILPAAGWQLSFPVGTNVQQFYRARFGP